MIVTTAPRRVLIIVENLPVPLDTRVWNEATTLAAAGYEVSVICPAARGFERRFEVIDGIAIYRHPLPADTGRKSAYVAEYSMATYWQFRLAMRVLRERGFDVIHACNPPDTLFVLGLLFKLVGKRFIFDHHDLAPELYCVKFGRRDGIYRLLLRLERWSLRAADAVLSTNDSYRRIAIERGGVAPERIHIVRSAPNLARLRIVPPNPALKRGRRHLVGYAGLMGRQDGLDHLLEAARHIVHDLGRDDIQFCLAGSGPELDRLRAASAALRISEHVDFPGWLDGHDLLQVLNTADVCVSPDEPNEMNDKCTMTKVMEYMAVGKPIVQFESTEGRFSAQGASLYARPNDIRDYGAKIVELLDDPERRAAMGEIGRARVNGELAWSHQVPALLAAYDTVFTARPNARRSPDETIAVAVKGRLIEMPALRIRERAVVISGKWLKVARVHDEEWISKPLSNDPDSFIRLVRDASPAADLFTFVQDPAAPVEYPYPSETEDVAVIAITSWADWWTSLPRIGRKNARRAERRGVVVERAVLDDALVRGIKELYDEVPVRQGRRFWHYGKDLDTVRRINASYAERSEFLATYWDGAMIGFMKIVFVDRVARIMQILAGAAYSDQRPTNAMIAKAVEVCCQRGMTHLIYGQYVYGSKGETPLSDFKRRNGFRRIELRRYFVPLTRKGEAALALRLHRGAAELVPAGAVRLFLNARARLYTWTSPART